MREVGPFLNRFDSFEVKWRMATLCRPEPKWLPRFTEILNVTDDQQASVVLPGHGERLEDMSARTVGSGLLPGGSTSGRGA